MNGVTLQNLLREWQALEHLFIEVTGPLGQIKRENSEIFDSLGLLSVTAAASIKLPNNTRRHVSGVGKGGDNATRNCGAVGEFLERLNFLSNYPTVRQQSGETLDGPVGPLDSIVGFSPDGYAQCDLPFASPNLHEAIDWSVAVEVESGERFYVPFESGAGQRRWYRPTTSGWAAGWDDRASASAILEIVERDALMLAWHTQDFGVHLAVPQNPFSRAIESFGFEINLYDVTSNIPIPVVVAKISCIENRPGFKKGASLFSGAAALTYDAAVQSAIYGTGQKLEQCANLDPTFYEFNQILNPIDHILFYLNPENSRHLENINVNHLPSKPPHEETIVTDKSPALLDDVFKRLNSQGYSPLIVDETRPEFIIDGFKVVRALVPGLIPHSFGPTNAMRLFDLDRRITQSGRCPSTKPLATLPPHPFA